MMLEYTFSFPKILIIGLGLTLFACIIFPWMTLVAMFFGVISIIFMHFAQYGIQESKRIEGSCKLSNNMI